MGSNVRTIRLGARQAEALRIQAGYAAWLVEFDDLADDDEHGAGLRLLADVEIDGPTLTLPDDMDAFRWVLIDRCNVLDEASTLPGYEAWERREMRADRDALTRIVAKLPA